MNILMLVAGNGMKDARVRKEAEALVTAGHEVSVFGFSQREDPMDLELNGVRYVTSSHSQVRSLIPRGVSRILRHGVANLSPASAMVISLFFVRYFALWIKGIAIVSALVLVKLLISRAAILIYYIGVLISVFYIVTHAALNFEIYISNEMEFGDLQSNFSSATNLLLFSLAASTIIVMVFFSEITTKIAEMAMRPAVDFLSTTLPKYQSRLASRVSREFSKGENYRKIRLASRFMGAYPGLLDYFFMGIRRYFDLTRYNVIHAHDLNTLLPASRIARRAKHLRLVFDAHELATDEDGWDAPASKLFKRYVMRSSIKKVSGVVTVNPFFAAKFRERYGIRNICVTYNSPQFDLLEPGVRLSDSDLSDVRTSIGLAAEAPLVVYIGGINRRRGSLQLAHAIAELPDDIHFVFVTGSNIDVRREIRQIVRARSATNGRNLHFLPPVPQEILVKYVSTASASVITRLPPAWYFNPQREYALPNKLFESMFAQLPLILGDCAAHREILKEFPVGVCARTRDPAAFAEAIVRVVRNRGAFTYTPAIIEGIRQKYSWEKSAESLVKFYENAVRR